MDFDLLYVRDCPHRSLARDPLNAALVRTRLRAVVREREVHSSEEAARLGKRESPTILIDGQHPFATPDEPAGLSCRLGCTRAEPASAAPPPWTSSPKRSENDGARRR